MHGENSKKAKELEELHSQLATNMGHQNQKQKIKYMVSFEYQFVTNIETSDQNKKRAARDERKAVGTGV